MGEPLFRPQVLEAARESWLGGISLAQPVSLRVLAGFAALATAAILVFLAIGEYTRRSRVVGQLVPDLGLATVIAPVAGVVRDPVPHEGVAVERGRPLVVIAIPRATTASGDTTARLLAGIETEQTGLEQSFAAQSALLDARRAGYSRQLAAARRELKQLDAAIETKQAQANIGRELLAHLQKLATHDYVSQVTLAQQEQSALEQTASLQALERQSSALYRAIAGIEQTLSQLPAEESAQKARKTRELAELARQRLQIEANSEVLVKAPVSGLVSTRLVERGQTVQRGQPLLSLLPDGSTLQARLLVPSRAIGFIDPGDPVVLRYQAFPHQKFGHYRGTVLRISRSALSPRGLGSLIGDTGTGEPFYRVIVALDEQSITAYGSQEPLRPGMLVEADILGERRKLYEWLLEPLYSLTGRL